MSRRLDVSAVVSLIKNLDTEMLNDDEWNRLKEVDPNQEEKMLKVFEEFIVSDYEGMDSRSKSLIRDGLKSILSSYEFDFSCVLQFIEMPFEPIDKPRNFFLLLWYSLFKERFWDDLVV
ncbi:hypothetical protein [Marinobacter sp. ANT_B65]|uniref:hypothetical protein n=1 Tax=Marinobacter sp. ANT_B65 TaxID=2039467 RepID=UPI000BBE5B38|nr:hypothetical protein [Marinobacter sp. ANT_B65]PCM44853.1 hypothetical protein CPA50_02125 [Marinobacter sp. ANT_B65]